MAGKVRIFFRLTIRTYKEEPQFRLPLPVACIIVSLIWLWVRVSLGMPADTPLFHDKYWIFGDGLAIALGVIGVVFTLLWIKDVVMSIVFWIKDLIC